MAIRNIGRSRAQRYAVEIQGLKELQLSLRDLASAFGGGVKNTALSNDVHRVLADAAKHIASRAISIGQSKGVPRRVLASIFTYANPSKDKPNRTAALVGVNKQKTLVSWYPRRSASTKAKKLIIPTAAGAGYGSQGAKISESLASMFERGTSKMKARTYFAAGLRSAGQFSLQFLSASLKAIVEKYKLAA